MTETLDDYKRNVDPTIRAKLAWERDLVFQATTARGYDLDFDAAAEWGCKPTEALVLSLAGCMAIDVVSILGKMKIPPASFSLEVEAERRKDPPQRLTAVRMVLRLEGDVPREKVERAVALSEAKYCSVRHSLRDDIDVTTEIVLG